MMYNAYFSNPIWVNSKVLSDLTMEEQQSIYFDTYYGMSDTRNLTIWVAATMRDEEAILTLKNHYWSGSSFRLSDTQLESIIYE